MGNAKSAVIGLCCSISLYLLVAWGCSEFIGGGAREFWTVLALLFGARLFFALIETAGGILSWRFRGRGIAVERFLRLLQINDFPRRYNDHDDFTNYLARVEDDEASPQSLKRVAKETYALFGMIEDLGVLLGARMHSASEIALEIYSPRANVRDFTDWLRRRAVGS